MDDEIVSTVVRVVLTIALLGLVGAMYGLLDHVRRSRKHRTLKESVYQKLPDEFSRRPAVGMLASVVVFCLVWMAFGITREDRAVIGFALVPMFLIMGIAGVVDPRLPWAIYPDAANKMPARTRFFGSALCVISVLIGLAWFLWIHLEDFSWN